MAKAVHHKQGLRMDEIRNFKAHLAHADARGVQNAHPVTRHKPGGPGPFRMYPGGIFRHLLQQQGVAVPLSCEMGMCGACLTPVIEGVVDHRDTVQSPAEKAATAQRIALCCSRSRSPNLLIDL